MMIPPYAAGSLPMPRWAYVPGETDEANADYETLAQAKLLVPPRFRGYVPARHPALRYGLTLNDRGYFWESQEILEAVWAAAPQGGRECILLRACILIASANLRLRMQKPHAAARLLGEGCRSFMRSARARRLRRAMDLPTAFRPRHWSSCSRAGWTSHCCPRPIGSKSAPSSEHETKCIFWRSGVDWLPNMHYSAS
jgi:DUF309 family protein family protein